MRVTVTGATGLIGTKLVAALAARGDDVTVLSRDPERAREKLAAAASGSGTREGSGASGAPGTSGEPGAIGAPGARPAGRIDAVAWDPSAGPAPAAALSGRDAVVHLAGEPVAQRWSDAARARIRDSRATGTRNLVVGLKLADPHPRVLVSASAVGYYGPHGDERVDESIPPGSDFLAGVCVVWERAAQAAEEQGMRVVRIRTGVVLDPDGGALAKMLPPFKLGAGGPVAGGQQYMPWIHADDLVGLYLAALDGDERWSGPLNGSSPTPVTNAEFSKALGRALHRPAVAPVPRLALKLLYGEMERIVTTGQRAVPAKPLELGYQYAHPDLDEALRAALG